MGKVRKNARVKKTSSSVSKPSIAAKTSKPISKNVKKDNVTEYDDISKFYAVVRFLESKGLVDSATSLRTELGEKLNVSLWTVGAVLKFGSMNRVEFALAKAEEAGKAAAAAAARAAAIAEEEVSSSDENSDSSDENSDSSDEEGANPAETGRKIVSSSSMDSSSGEGSHRKTEKTETQQQKKVERITTNTDSSSDESSDDSDDSSDDEAAQIPVKKTKQVDTSSSSSNDSNINEEKNVGKASLERTSNVIHNISHSSSSSSSSSSESDSSDDSSSKGNVCTPKTKARSVREENITVSDVSDVEVSDTDVSSSDDSSSEQSSSSSDNESDDEDSSDEESSSDDSSSEDEEEVNARIAAKKKAAEAKAKAAAAAAASWKPTPPKKNVNVNVEKGTDGAQALSSGKPFTRVDSDYWGEVATKDGGAMADNSYEGAFGGGGFGSKSSEKLLQVQGKRFQHEKTKRKRSFNGFARTGGAISQDSFSTKFCYSDDEN